MQSHCGRGRCSAMPGATIGPKSKYLLKYPKLQQFTTISWMVFECLLDDQKLELSKIPASCYCKNIQRLWQIILKILQRSRVGCGMGNVWRTTTILQHFCRFRCSPIIWTRFCNVGTLIRFILAPLVLLSVTQGRGGLWSLLCPPAGAIPSIGDFTTIYNNAGSPPPISAKRVFQANPFHKVFIWY